MRRRSGLGRAAGSAGQRARQGSVFHGRFGDGVTLSLDLAVSLSGSGLSHSGDSLRNAEPGHVVSVQHQR